MSACQATISAADPMVKFANLSACGTYRYLLGRQWSDAAPLTFVMLNPSTADAKLDDPTIRRCMGFARRENAGGILVVNLFAFRAKNPRELEGAADPVGPLNDGNIHGAACRAALNSAPVVVAWGAINRPDRIRRVLDILRDERIEVVCLGKTKSGAPRHPLYLRADQPFEPFS